MRRAPFALAAALLCAAPAAAQPSALPDGPIVAVYSDICVHEETGDLLGDRIIVIYSEGATYAVLQTAEGEAPDANLARAQIVDGAITFTINTWPPQAFRGRITASEITGTFAPARETSIGATTFRLARQANQQAPTPAC